MYFCEKCKNYYEEDEMDWSTELIEGVPMICNYCKEVENEKL